MSQAKALLDPVVQLALSNTPPPPASTPSAIEVHPLSGTYLQKRGVGGRDDAAPEQTHWPNALSVSTNRISGAYQWDGGGEGAPRVYLCAPCTPATGRDSKSTAHFGVGEGPGPRTVRRERTQPRPDSERKGCVGGWGGGWVQEPGTQGALQTTTNGHLTHQTIVHCINKGFA